MDVLSGILRSFALRASVFFHSSYCGDWSVDTSGARKATFHVVARGACWLHLPDRPEPIALQGGDVVVFPRDAKHVLSNAMNPRDASAAARGANTASTALICGYFEFEEHAWNPLLDALPEVVVIRADEVAHTALMDTLIRFLAFEAEAAGLGSDIVIDRLCDVLFIQVVRTCLKRARYEEGFLGALADPALNRVLNAIHERPQAPWTVESLAQAAGMSRSAFAGHFHRLVGLTPMQYVTRWRMQCAHHWLSTTRQSVLAVAEHTGYANEAAFSKAFKRQFGVGPGAVRRAGRGV